MSIEQPFSILFSINIDKNLHVQIYHEKKLIPPSCYHHILSSEKVTLFSEVENLIAFEKNLDQNITTLMETIKAKLLNLIEKYIDLCQDDYKKKPLKFNGIYPIKNLKAETQKACFDKVMLLVHEIGFNVIGICVDNASANRKFFKDFLCNGAWKASIPNKYTDGKIFLIFDPTHIIKNIYNNLVNRRVFEMPCMTPILDTPLTASFADIEKVYNLECQKLLRIAHRLTETVLKPNSIEKVNVKLALAVFHESTVIGLKEYGFHETASAIDLFLKLWNILNVSTSEIGKHKRDISRDPVRSTADWKLKFLTDFGHYVSFWKNSNVSMFCKLFLFKNIKQISYLYLIC